MDFTKLRATALKDGDDEEAVTVNTRALIDKVLARYSGEWTTLRELLQNAADAQATTVKIKFETLPSASVPLSNTTNKSEILKHVLLHHTLRRLLVTNDGQAFGANDWSRLKRIAEGNPDETKIGAFGVGFYSVFADCEEPFVSSGNEAMAFYWKGNSLFTRRLQLPPEQGNPETSFVLDYRNTTTPMPNLLSIAQFLATSLTFVALKNIELWVDDWKIITLKKKSAPGVNVPIARDVETKTKEGLMKVQSLEKESVQMDAEFMNVVGWKPSLANSAPKPGSYDSAYGAGDVPSLRSFFSRLTSSTSQTSVKAKALREESAFQDIILEDLTALTTTNVFLRVTTAVIRTSIGSQFAAELERATKKPPPKTTKLAILTSSYDETAASSQTDKVANKVDLFASVLPGKKPGGRIFIGFPTHQTTGAGMHLSAPSVIPTVERESIDLNARWVRTWNQEMLRVAGIIARLAFASEMSDLSLKVKRACEIAGHPNKVTKTEVAQFMPEALHTLKTFTFEESTPSSHVSQLIEEAFWTTYRQPYVDIYSTQGVLPTTKVRLATEDLSGFVEGIPVVPDELANGSFVSKLKDFGIITEITFEDVKSELSAKALNQTQLIQFISWAGTKALSGEIGGTTIPSLMDVAVAMTGDVEGQGDIIALGSITSYLNVSKIPADVPVPPTTIPFKFTNGLSKDELQALGWEPLEIVPWLRFLIETNANRPPDQNFTTSVPFAAKVLQILSKAWDGNLAEHSKRTIVMLLQPIPIVPTKLGIKKPGEAFFQSVKLFEDLPTVVNCSGVKEKFFSAIGVRKTVDLETIFSRLLAPTVETNPSAKNTSNRHMELIKYLASVSNDIPADDLKRLKASQICPAEAGPKGLESTVGTARLYRVSELFEPKDDLRSLGFPILQWAGPPGSYRAGSIEGRFLSKLGIRGYPSVPELIDMMTSAVPEQREKSMNYFIATHHMNGYASFDVSGSTKQFLSLQGDDKRLVSPAECFTNEDCAVLGFNILRKDLRPHANKFGVAMDPPMTECVKRLLAKPPQNRRDATTLFAYFASRLGELGQNHVAKIADARIVPVASKQTENGYPDEKATEKPSIRHLTPLQCYLGTSSTYSEIFDFVDFGNTANTFLLKCGSKHEPTKFELAALVSKEPARLLGVMQSPDRYLNLLRTLADELPSLKRDKLLYKQMKTAKWLLGSVEIPSSKDREKARKSAMNDGAGSDQEDDESTSIKQYQLATPSQIVVVDDYNSYRLFKSSLICAPMDDKMEEFYLALGAQTIGDLVQEDLRLGAASDKQATAVKLRSHILERAKIFLHEHKLNEIKHDARWMEKNLSLQVVSSISLRRSLRGHSLSHTEKRSAAYQHDRYKGYILYVTADGYDTYQLSQALCKLLLDRPNQSDVVLLESFLNLSLYQLRSRGYNVERILRAKAAEARIAEEQQKKHLEAEQQQIKEQERIWKEQNQQAAAPAPTPAREPRESKEVAMPGAFGSDSPENSPEPASRAKSRGLFSTLSKRFGGRSSSPEPPLQQQLNNFLGGGDQQDDRPPPPSYDESSTSTTKPGTKGTGTETVSSPHQIHQNLLNAIASSRAHDSKTLFSPPTTQDIKEATTYCDSTPAQNLQFLATTSNNTKIFISKTLASTLAPTEFLSRNVDSLNTFALLLHEVADVYNLPHKALHIFYDERGSTIAFNANGSLFANFRFWQQLHERNVGVVGDRGEGRVEALAYWWVTVAHELAHNLVKEHNADHAFYTESLISHYFPKMMARASSYTASAPASVQSTTRSVNHSLPPPPSSGNSYGGQGSKSLLD